MQDQNVKPFACRLPF